MKFNALIENKFDYLSTVILFIVPFYTWKRLYDSYKVEKKKYEKELLFHSRHNCVVMYYPTRGLRGWPPNTRRKCPKMGYVLDTLFSPIIYFIDSAEKSLDVAVMAISARCVIDALQRAKERGVEIRALYNFYQRSRMLDSIGIDLMPYVSVKDDMSSIMHYKFIIKDFSHDGGYICLGSMNFTASSTNNFEDFVFTSDKYVVDAAQENFEDCWHYVYNTNRKSKVSTIIRQEPTSFSTS